MRLFIRLAVCITLASCYWPWVCNGALGTKKDVDVPGEWNNILLEDDRMRKGFPMTFSPNRFAPAKPFTEKEVILLKMYTASFFELINCLLMNPEYKKPDWWVSFVMLWHSALSKCGPYGYATFRGTLFQSEPQVGQRARNLGYLSTSKTPLAAVDFAKKGVNYVKPNGPVGPYVLMMVPGATQTTNSIGKVLQYSTHGYESEVLALANSCWYFREKIDDQKKMKALLESPGYWSGQVVTPLTDLPFVKAIFIVEKIDCNSVSANQLEQNILSEDESDENVMEVIELLE
jgi:hypothetical protein